MKTYPLNLLLDLCENLEPKTHKYPDMISVNQRRRNTSLILDKVEQCENECKFIMDWSIMSLTQREQEILTLRYKESKTLEQIGSRLSLSHEWVRKLLNKSIERLRFLYGQFYSDVLLETVQKKQYIWFIYVGYSYMNKPKRDTTNTHKQDIYHKIEETQTGVDVLKTFNILNANDL